MVKLKVNISMNGKKAGDFIDIPTDEKGNILDSFWARRLEDSKIDNCVEIVETEGVESVPLKNSSKGNK